MSISISASHPASTLRPAFDGNRLPIGRQRDSLESGWWLPNSFSAFRDTSCQDLLIQFWSGWLGQNAPDGLGLAPRPRDLWCRFAPPQPPTEIRALRRDTSEVDST